MLRVLAVLVLLFIFSSSVHSRELIIAVSPLQSPESAKAQAQTVLQFLSALQPGDRATLIDGEALSTLGEFTVPTNPAYNHPRARLTANRAFIAAYLNFAQRAALPVSTQGPRTVGALRWPQLLDMISSTLSPSAGSDIVLLGSPIFDAPEDAAFSMAADRFPSDGHLLGSRSETIYGTKDHPQALNGLRIHLVYEATPSLRNEQYRQAVLRIWTLFVERQGGKLVTFTSDLPSLFMRVSKGASAPAHSYKLGTSTRMEMIRLSPQTHATIYERPLSQHPLLEQDIQRAQNLEVGLSWNCADCDLDLHAKAHPGAPALYYGRMDTAEGRYWKDFLRSPQSTGGFETITFSAPVDLRAATIVVNHFSGKAITGLRAELRLSINGQTFAGTLEFAAGDGNAGVDVRTVLERGQSTARTRIVDLLAILKPAP